MYLCKVLVGMVQAVHLSHGCITTSISGSGGIDLPYYIPFNKVSRFAPTSSTSFGVALNAGCAPQVLKDLASCLNLKFPDNTSVYSLNFELATTKDVQEVEHFVELVKHHDNFHGVNIASSLTVPNTPTHNIASPPARSHPKMSIVSMASFATFTPISTVPTPEKVWNCFIRWCFDIHS